MTETTHESDVAALLELRGRATRFGCTVALTRINSHFGGQPGGSPFTTMVSVKREDGRDVVASAARPGELGKAVRNVLAMFP